MKRGVLSGVLLVTCLLAIPSSVFAMGMDWGGGGGSSDPPPVTTLFSAHKTITTVAPFGRISARPAGGFVVTIPSKKTVQTYDSNYTLIRSFQISGHPLAVEVLGNGDLLIGDRIRGEVVRYSPQGRKIGFLGNGPGEFKAPVDIAVNRSSNKIYVADARRHCVGIYDWDGRCIGTIGSSGTSTGQFRFPCSVTVHPTSGEIYVCDFVNKRVQVFSSDGTYSRLIGGSGMGAGLTYHPSGVAIDGNNRVLIADSYLGWVQAFDTTGVYLGLAAAYGSTNGKLRLPSDLTVDGANRMLVASSGDKKVEVFSSNLAGNLTLTVLPEPAHRQATVIFPEGIFDTSKDAPVLVTFRMEMWGIRARMIKNNEVMLNGSIPAVFVRFVRGARPGVVEIDFVRRLIQPLLLASGGELIVEIAGLLPGGSGFLGSMTIQGTNSGGKKAKKQKKERKAKKEKTGKKEKKEKKH